MKTQTQPSVAIRPFLSVILFTLVFTGSSLVHAQNAPPPRFRGPIVSVNLEKKVLTVTTKHGDVTAKWDDQSDVRSPADIRTFEQLKPGMFVRIYMKKDLKTIYRVRHQPENDTPVEE